MYLNRILIIFPLIPSRQIRHVVLLDESAKTELFSRNRERQLSSRLTLYFRTFPIFPFAPT